MPDPRSDEVSDPSDLSERYGSTSPRQRVIATVLIVVVAVSSVGFVGWTAQRPRPQRALPSVGAAYCIEFRKREVFSPVRATREGAGRSTPDDESQRAP